MTRPPRIVAWGSYDRGKPRVRLLLDALRARGMLAAEINIAAWQAIDDKSVAGSFQLLAALLKLLIGYPLALGRLLREPSCRSVLLPYPAIIDIFVVWPLARLRGQRIIVDAFIGFHDTIVGDRKRLAPAGLLARALWRLEKTALRLADLILVDTDAHGRYFAENFGVAPAKLITALVGAEPLFWSARGTAADTGQAPPHQPIVLFYGQLIPLHGLQTILGAVARTSGLPFHWMIVGRGQDEPVLRRFVDDVAPPNLTWLPWVDYEALPQLIRSATVSLGIFGESDKAARVIPNKLFQILAAGGTVITRESPAVADLAKRYPNAVRLVPAGDSDALAAAVFDAVRSAKTRTPVPVTAREALSPLPGVDRLVATLDHLGDPR